MKKIILNFLDLHRVVKIICKNTILKVVDFGYDNECYNEFTDITNRLSSILLLRPYSHETQYCDKNIKIYCDKKIFLSHGFQ